MNEISNLIENYNRFITDLGLLNQDVGKIITTHNLEWKYEFWAPRDRAAWSLKKTFTSKYSNKNEVFYLGFDLDNDLPYLLLERMYDLINCTPDEFYDTHGFSYIFDSSITKKKDILGCYSFEQDWGKVKYAKINLIEITSQEIVTSEIKSIIDYLFGNKINELKTIKLL